MTKVLLRYSAKSTALAVLLATGLCFVILGEAHGLGALIGGVIAGADFVFLVYLVGHILDPGVSTASKVTLGVFMMVKLTVVAAVLFLAISRLPIGDLGVLLGVGAAIGGFTFGASRGAASPEGQAAMKAQDEEFQRKKRADEDAESD